MPHRHLQLSEWDREESGLHCIELSLSLNLYRESSNAIHVP